MPAEDGSHRFPFSTGETDTLIAYPLAVIILVPFIVIFVWAAWLEIRRWWLYGPSQNKRADYPIDEDAPSYQPPAPTDRGSAAAGDEQDRKD